VENDCDPSRNAGQVRQGVPPRCLREQLVKAGLTAKRAPTSATFANCSAVVTVPAPITASEFAASMRRITSCAGAPQCDLDDPNASLDQGGQERFRVLGILKMKDGNDRSSASPQGGAD
jgi:hypothetical protein